MTGNVVTFNKIMDKKFTRGPCNRSFLSSSNLMIPKNTKHEHVKMNFSCDLCRKSFRDPENYMSHIDNRKEHLSFVLYKSAFDSTIKIFRNHVKN